MYIENHQSKIICHTSGNNTPYDFLLELEILHFKKKDDSYFLDCNKKNILEIIKKIKKFASKYGVDLKLSDELQKKIKEQETFFSKIVETSSLLINTKVGNLDQNEFEIHKNIMNLGGRNLACKLLPHQELASFHHYNAKNAANFSVPGSGKTIAIYATYHRLKLENKIDSIFMIGPLTSFIAWKKDFEFFYGRVPKVKEFRGGRPDDRKRSYYDNNFYDLYLSTYQTSANDSNEIPNLLKKKRFLLILDEAHYIKRQGGDWAQAILNFCIYSKYRIALTGTPMPQEYQDLFNIFDFLYPENSILSNLEKHKIKSFQNKNDDENAIKILNETVYPFFYRVKKSDLNLKKQVIKLVKIRMNQEERFIYEAVKEKILSENEKDLLINIDALNRLWKARIIRLRQIFSYCALLKKALKSEETGDKEEENDVIKEMPLLESRIKNYVETPAKLSELMRIVKQHMGKNEKILIWSNFLGTIDLIDSEIKKENFYSEKIIGSTPNPSDEENDSTYNGELTRADIAERFNDPGSDLRILIANPASCAESISLHKACNHAIYYDLDYNCSKYLQSLDRIHRVGASEKRDSYYYILQYEDTVEDKILNNLKRKAEKMYQIIESDYPLGNNIDPENKIEIQDINKIELHDIFENE